jgi:tRNA A37 methylthiotransferase MiaB
MKANPRRRRLMSHLHVQASASSVMPRMKRKMNRDNGGCRDMRDGKRDIIYEELHKYTSI